MSRYVFPFGQLNASTLKEFAQERCENKIILVLLNLKMVLKVHKGEDDYPRKQARIIKPEKEPTFATSIQVGFVPSHRVSRQQREVGTGDGLKCNNTSNKSNKMSNNLRLISALTQIQAIISTIANYCNAHEHPNEESLKLYEHLQPRRLSQQLSLVIFEMQRRELQLPTLECFKNLREVCAKAFSEKNLIDIAYLWEELRSLDLEKLKADIESLVCLLQEREENLERQLYLKRNPGIETVISSLASTLEADEGYYTKHRLPENQKSYKNTMQHKSQQKFPTLSTSQSEPLEPIIEADAQSDGQLEQIAETKEVIFY